MIASGGGLNLYSVLLREVLKAANTVLLSQGVLLSKKGELQLLESTGRKHMPVVTVAMP